MNEFQNIYNKTYTLFYSSVMNAPSIISADPIPYSFDNSIKSVAQYENKHIIFQNDSLAKKRELCSTIFHELTHYYDDMRTQSLSYDMEKAECIMLTYSEIHAAYNAMMYYINYPSYSCKKLLRMNHKINERVTLQEYCKYSYNSQTKKINNPLGLKYLMYMLGEKRAFLKICLDKKSIMQLYTFNQLNPLIKKHVKEIDSMIYLDHLKDININALITHKLFIENELLKTSVNDIMSGMPDELKDLGIFNVFR